MELANAYTELEAAQAELDEAMAAEEGLLYGHKSILYDQPWNRDIVVDSQIERCYTWDEIVKHIREEQ